jgi:hypothetical protein
VAHGSVARHVGRLETVLGFYPDAEEHLAHAATRHEEWGAALYLARTWADQAELLLARDGQASVRAANELLDQASAVAREREAAGIAHYVDRVRERARGRGLAV